MIKQIGITMAVVIGLMLLVMGAGCSKQSSELYTKHVELTNKLLNIIDGKDDAIITQTKTIDTYVSIKGKVSGLNKYDLEVLKHNSEIRMLAEQSKEINKGMRELNNKK